MEEMEEIIEAIRKIRVPIEQSEYDLHKIIGECLESAGIMAEHEARLASRCRIDFLCGRTGIEIKRGKTAKSHLLSQVTKYLETGKLDGMIVVTECSVTLPGEIRGLPVRCVCLRRLWGIAI